MKILIKNNLIDFEAPIYATEEQCKKIIDYFKENYKEIVLKEVEEPPREYSKKESTEQHKWVASDYLKLFSDKSNEEIAFDLKMKTGMGVQIKRGTFVMSFLKWKEKKKRGSPVTLNLIQEYMSEESK